MKQQNVHEYMINNVPRKNHKTFADLMRRIDKTEHNNSVLNTFYDVDILDFTKKEAIEIDS